MIAQAIIYQNETEGFFLLQRYAETIKQRFHDLLMSVPTDISLPRAIGHYLAINETEQIDAFFHNYYNRSLPPEQLKLRRRNAKKIEYVYPVTSRLEEMEEFLLSFLLSETQGGIRTSTKVFDMPLSFMNFSLFYTKSDSNDHYFLSSEDDSYVLKEKIRFRLGIGLAKLGLYELSVKHVTQAAKPWRSPLYRLRAKLMFNSIHSSVGSLAIAINQFEKSIESILLSPSLASSHSLTSNALSSEMWQVCNSPNEAALAFQSLPLLHLLGYSSPRVGHSLGHSPVPLPVLLGEVYLKMCPLISSFNRTYYSKNDHFLPSSSPDGGIIPAPALKSRNSPKIRLGVVSGTFDGLTGRLMIGLFAGLSEHQQIRNKFEIVALCFPTPRSLITDRVNALFDDHINLSPENKTQIITRILQAKFDFLLFMDAALDARVFALAHERLATFQGLFWTYGGSLGIPTIDYYFIPEIFWLESKCPPRHLHSPSTFSSGSAALAASSASLSHSNSHQLHQYQLPQELYREQILFLEGIPFLPRLPPMSPDEVRGSMKAKYLLEISNRTNLYLLPISIKYLHPEFDKAIEVILRSDPRSMIVITSLRSGRDSLPPTHIAIRHDLMHPAMPMAAVLKLKKRFASIMKEDYLERIHVLPPLEESVFRALHLQSVAVLDTYPVGLHIPVLEAILDGVPVVSMPFLQECTNSYAINMQKSLNISYYLKFQKKFYFTTPEEYGVFAVQLSKDDRLKREMVVSLETLKKLSYQKDNEAQRIEESFKFNDPSRRSTGSKREQPFETEFTQYYHKNHHFVQILTFITHLRSSFTAH